MVLIYIIDVNNIPLYEINNICRKVEIQPEQDVKFDEKMFIFLLFREDDILYFINNSLFNNSISIKVISDPNNPSYYNYNLVFHILVQDHHNMDVLLLMIYLKIQFQDYMVVHILMKVNQIV